jgi:ABC-type branched-subunit amino acid transport system ATPase component
MSSVNKGLEVIAAGKRFGGLLVFEEVTFDAPEGQITALIGPNGAGKTTLINMICGALRADHGELRKGGRSLAGVRPSQALRHGLARTFQDVRAFPTLTALENVLVALPDQPGDRLLPLLGRRWRTADRKALATALDLLAQLGLEANAHQPAGSLPFGSQKLLGLARAAATGADTLLLDEPTSGVELQRVPLVTSFLRDLRSSGRTVLLIEHNVEVVAELADQVVVLQGRVIASGAADRVLRDRRVIDEYLGRLYDA